LQFERGFTFIFKLWFLCQNKITEEFKCLEVIKDVKSFRMLRAKYDTKRRVNKHSFRYHQICPCYAFSVHPVAT